MQVILAWENDLPAGGSGFPSRLEMDAGPIRGEGEPQPVFIPFLPVNRDVLWSHRGAWRARIEPDGQGDTAQHSE